MTLTLDVGVLAEVRALHRPVDVEPSETICAECSPLHGVGVKAFYLPTVEWPCSTIIILDREPAPDVDVIAEVRAYVEHMKHDPECWSLRPPVWPPTQAAPCECSRRGLLALLNREPTQ